MLNMGLPGEEMPRTVKIERELFEAMLRKMISPKRVPLAKIPKSKEKSRLKNDGAGHSCALA